MGHIIIRDERLDANETVFFQRELEYISRTNYELKFPALKARGLIPTQSDIPDWAMKYTWRMFEPTGQAEFLAPGANEAPQADYKGEESSKDIYCIVQGYGYDIFELRAAAKTGTPLDRFRARAARRAIDTKIDDVLALGNDDRNLDGLLNLPGVTALTAGTKAAGGTSWGTTSAPNATADEMLEDLLGIAAKVAEDTSEMFGQVDILLPIAQYNLAAQTAKGNNADRTVLRYALENSPYIRSITPWHKCKGAGAGGVDRMVAYPRDPDVVAAIVPQEYTELPPERKGFRWNVNAYAKCGGVVCRYPIALRYMDGI